MATSSCTCQVSHSKFYQKLNFILPLTITQRDNPMIFPSRIVCGWHQLWTDPLNLPCPKSKQTWCSSLITDKLFASNIIHVVCCGGENTCQRIWDIFFQHRIGELSIRCKLFEACPCHGFVIFHKIEDSVPLIHMVVLLHEWLNISIGVECCLQMHCKFIESDKKEKISISFYYHCVSEFPFSNQMLYEGTCLVFIQHSVF